ncbi:sulfur oxidation c-type cytochrome SoxA [Belnapia sp. T18]|uniref:L-cysteine S-thiosulfotransferase subunit SoxA n=2 Tax=Belnapia arida TaxID=2804533 RepID=A0ABS1U5G6_9PROT|nr:sulfur oxidation c-type cytochrome SoxA [Belnapia arida]
MQREDSANPGMLWVEEGRALWDSAGCAGCHGDVVGMRGVAARYPALDAAPIDLAGRIAQCQEARQHRTPFPRESEEALALAAVIGLQSRGMPVNPPDDPRLAPALARGEALYRERRGQLDLSCAQCHDANAGRHLAGSPIPEAHPTGYPLYRLEWQGMGSLQRRLRNCMMGVRSEPYAYGAPEYVAIELFLMRRAAGMAVETPAVRP